jgi:glycosyltransferase involved in cell wall biosynthesis
VSAPLADKTLQARFRALRQAYPLVEAVWRSFVFSWQAPVRFGQRIANRLFRFGGTKLGQLRHHPPRPLRIPARYRRIVPPQPAPRISLVTPSYNQAAFLEATMRSVLDQGYPALEYVVQDGGSKDGTPVILEQYRDRLLHVESVKDNGQADAINRGFRHATGEILAWLNSDDLLLPGSLAAVARYFADHPDVDVVYGHRVLIDHKGREIGRWLLPPQDDHVLRWVDYVPQETLFWRRRIWEAVGGRVDDTFQFALDWDLLLRFQAAGAKIVRLPQFLGAFRVHPGQKTSADMTTIGRREIERLWMRLHGFVPDEHRLACEARTYHRRHVWLNFRHAIGMLGH